ncbi:uncharacterized protein TNCV_1716711 [Trichonephila clavipes]|nr:uncharacterized protein TNCV_1716711 [Trichonephila clavipes]
MADEGFEEWKKDEEIRTKSSFVKRGGAKKVTNKQFTYYMCHRSLISIIKSERKRHEKIGGSVKCGKTCPAFMTSIREQQEAIKITVEYQSVYAGREMEVGHLKHLLGDSFRFVLIFNNMTSETVEVARIALRLPPFWKSNVRLWIAQCDHAFTFSGIPSDDTKYSALVANLDAETLSYVSDIVLSPPNSDKYHTHSQRLITQFSDSETQKIKKLLTDLQLDEKPSHLLRKMKELSNGQLQDDFLQSLWLQRMPPHIQIVLSASSEPLDKLNIIADKVSEVVRASPTICAATTVPPPSQSFYAVLSQPWTLSPGRSKS